MIYVATGTHAEPCDRLLRVMETWAVEQGEEVLFQGAKPGVSFKSLQHVHLLSPKAHREAIQRARVVVTHAGPATIMDVLEQGKVPLVVPRDPEYGEHVDAHQIRFAGRLGDDVQVVQRLADLPGLLKCPPGAPSETEVDRQARSDEVAQRVGALVTDLVTRHGPVSLWRRAIRRAVLGSA